MRRRSETTRTIIIDAARQLFLTQGYVTTTVDAIAERAKLTKRTIYGYFPDKRALFKGVIEAAVGDPWEFHIPLEGIVTLDGLESALFAIAKGMDEIIARPDYVQLLRVTIAEIPTQPDLRILFERGVTRRSLRVTIGMLQAASDHGVVTLKHPEAAARQFVGGLILKVFLDGLLHASPNLTTHTTQELSAYVEDFLGRLTLTKGGA